MLVFNDIPVSEVFADIPCRPVFSAALHAHIERTGFEGFKCHVIVKVIIVAKGIEIPAAPVYRQVCRPVVFDPGIDNILPHAPVSYTVWATRQRGRGERVTKFVIFPERFRHHGQGEQAEHVLFIRLTQLNTHRERGNGFDRNAFVDNAELGNALSHKFVKCEGNVAGFDRRPIVKTRPWVNRNFRPRKVIRVTHVVRNQRVVTAGFIIRRNKQRIVERFCSRCRHAAQGEAVEVVERPRGGESHVSAFWRGRVDVIKVRKIDRVLWLTNHGERDVLFDGLRLAGQAR